MQHQPAPIHAYTKTVSLPVYSSADFVWKQKSGTTKSSDLIEQDRITGSESLRNGIFVKSTRSNKVLYFAPVYDEDGYDGEFMVYNNDEENINVTIWNY